MDRGQKMSVQTFKYRFLELFNLLQEVMNYFDQRSSCSNLYLLSIAHTKFHSGR